MKIFDFFKKIFKKRNNKDIKIGLALGSGGAKGFAHIGALKAFEEYGIKFDMVSGTSIGSVVGGMLSCGYSSTDMFNFINQYNLTDIKTILKMKFKRVTVESFLNEILGGVSFSDTLIPFYAVACDLNSGEEVVINDGNLAKALACSTAIVPMFKPVPFGDRKLIDGAYVNAVPGDVLRQNGCDIVISVSLTSRKNSVSDLQALNSAYKNNGLKSCDRLVNGINASDVFIEPDLSGYTSSSLSDFSKIYELGYNETIKKMPEILAVINGKKGKKNIHKKSKK